MSAKEMIVSALQEFIVPELDKIKEESRQIKVTLEITNKRLDDINLHLADQSRRIDTTNERIDAIREELGQRIDTTNERLDRLYEVIVRRDEHAALERRLANLEQEVTQIKERMAA